MIKIQEVSTPGCSHCAAAKELLEGDIRSEFPDIEIEYIDMSSEQGQELVVKHGIMSSPGIIVNDELFSVGGLSKEKLVGKIRSLS